MKDQKFERENKKIILGMVIGTVVSVALLLWYIGSGSGWHLDIMQIIIALALGLVMGTLFGGLIAGSLISNKGELSSWNIWLQCLATGLVFVLLDLIFDWITKSNNGSLKTMIFSNDTLWALAFGMAMGAIFLRKK